MCQQRSGLHLSAVRKHIGWLPRSTSRRGHCNDPAIGPMLAFTPGDERGRQRREAVPRNKVCEQGMNFDTHSKHVARDPFHSAHFKVETNLAVPCWQRSRICTLICAFRNTKATTDISQVHRVSMLWELTQQSRNTSTCI